LSFSLVVVDPSGAASSPSTTSVLVNNRRRRSPRQSIESGPTGLERLTDRRNVEVFAPAAGFDCR
jgi:hypothetical protein